MKEHKPWQVRRKLVVGDYVIHKEWGRVPMTKVLQVKSCERDTPEDPQFPVYLIQTSPNNRAWCPRDVLERVYWSDVGEDDSVIVSVEPPIKKDSE